MRDDPGLREGVKLVKRGLWAVPTFCLWYSRASAASRSTAFVRALGVWVGSDSRIGEQMSVGGSPRSVGGSRALPVSRARRRGVIRFVAKAVVHEIGDINASALRTSPDADSDADGSAGLTRAICWRRERSCTFEGDENGRAESGLRMVFELSAAIVLIVEVWGGKTADMY